jgi:MFS family permease
MYVAVAAAFLLLAIPAGQLADRIGRGTVFLFGHGLQACACLLILLSDASLPVAAASLLLLGGYYACTDGVLVALASPYLPEDLRSTGIGLLTTMIGVARFLASVLFGTIWGVWSLESALALYVAGTVLVLLLMLRPLTRLSTQPGHVTTN